MIDLTLIKQALEPVLSRFPVAFVYLYGSQMRGQTHAESDVDIALGFAANLKKDHDDLILDIYPELTRALKIPVEKIDLQNFDRLPLPVRFRVIRDGKLLYCRDPKYQHKQVFKTLYQYHDEAPYLERAYQAFLQRAVS